MKNKNNDRKNASFATDFRMLPTEISMQNGKQKANQLGMEFLFLDVELGFVW
jgi:hypothetical protein